MYTSLASTTEAPDLVTYLRTTVLNDYKSKSNDLQSNNLVLQGWFL